MAWDKGFNFRNTASYVTDGANETNAAPTGSSSPTPYPTTQNGVTYGWVDPTSSVAPTDLDNTVDRRFAGRCYTQPGTKDTFRVDLPAAGTYSIRIANGATITAPDPGGPPMPLQYLELFDDATSKLVLSNASVAVDTYYDASNVLRTEANWPADNVAVNVTFASTILKLTIGTTSTLTSQYVVIAHLFVSQSSSYIPPGRAFSAQHQEMMAQY